MLPLSQHPACRSYSHVPLSQHCFLMCLLRLSIAFSTALLCLSILDTVLAVPKLPCHRSCSHVHCFVSASRRSYVVSVSRCSCSLMCLALFSSASHCSLMCFALSQHHVAHVLCLVSAGHHTITPSRRSSVLCLFQATRS